MAGEHAILLQQVGRYEDQVLRVLDGGGWPQQELRELSDYLRYELLDQAVQEERLLFPLADGGFSNVDVQRLIGDHVALRSAADQLAEAVAAGPREQDADRLTDFLRSLRQLLDRHLAHEQRVLGAVTPEGVEQRRQPRWSRELYQLTAGPVLDLDVLPAEFTSRAAMERLARLAPGEAVEVRSSTALSVLRALVANRWGADYGWSCLEEGPHRWRAEIVRRRPD